MEKNTISDNKGYGVVSVDKGTFFLTDNTIDDLSMSKVELKTFQGNKFTNTVSISGSRILGTINNCTLNSISLTNNTGKIEISNNTISGSISISNSVADIIRNIGGRISAPIVSASVFAKDIKAFEISANELSVSAQYSGNIRFRR